MIKVIVGYRLKIGMDIQPVLIKLRSYAMTFSGFVSAENLVNAEDNTIFALVYTWENIENWKTWENTKIRKQILQEAEKLLREQPRVTIYNVVPTTGWSYVRSDS
jgi:antibiotic biosynthesis monooxygenase (ABM) superfamily enzyme